MKNKLLILFSLLTCIAYSQCSYKLYMYDSYGDGWNGAYLEVLQNGSFEGNYECNQTFTFDTIFSLTGDGMEFIFHSGSYDNEISFTIIAPAGDTLLNILSGDNLDDLDSFTNVSNSTCQNTNPCSNPLFLSAGNIQPNSADLLWQAGGNETSWNLEWGVSGFNLGNGTSVNGLTNTNYNISSLSNNTSYDFYVQAICDSTTNSIWSGPLTFNTNNNSTGGTCGSFTLQLYDSYGDGWNGASLDVIINGSPFQNITLVNGNGPETFTFSTDSSDIIDILYNTGTYDDENTYNLLDNSNNLIVSQGEFGLISNVDPVSTFGIEACTPCPQPSNLSANTNTAGTAQLGWNGGSGTFNIEWGTTGFTIGSGNVINSISTNSYLLNSLNNGTSYDFYVQESCSANEISTWAGPFSFTTAVVAGSCGLFSLELNDSFGDGWNGGFIDIIVNGNVTSSGLTVSFNPQSGGFSETFSISVDIGDVVDFVYTLGAYPEENSYKAFDQNGVLIFEEGVGNVIPNNVVGVEACPSCPVPTNLSANTGTAGTADLNWVGGNGTFNIEWGPTGFNQGNGTIINNISLNSYLLSGLSSITTYDYYVQEVCSPSELSNWAGPYTFTTVYFSSGSECGFYNLKLINNFGQGWGNSFAKVKINNNVYQNYTLSNGTSETFSFPLDSNDILDIVINFSSSGVWGSDLQYILFDPNNAVIASEQGTGNNEPPANTYGYQACATAPNSPNDFCDIYTLIMSKVFGGNWQGNVEIEINNNVEYVGSFVGGGYRRSEPISFGVRGNDEVRVIANGLNVFDEYYTVQNGLGDTIIDFNNGNSPTITVQPCYFVGLENQDINQNIKIYPNPARDIVTIDSPNGINKISIYNIIGELIFNTSFVESKTILDVSYFNQGVYEIILIDNKNRTTVKKLIIQ